jgi:hypothetical protein
LGEDRRSGAFELLLATPLTVGDFLRGQMLALRRQFLKPLLLVTALELTLVVAAKRQPYFSASDMLTCIAGICILWADVLALIWVAMAAALTCKNQTQATSYAVVRILILPWVLFSAVLTGFNLLYLADVSALATGPMVWAEFVVRPGIGGGLVLWPARLAHVAKRFPPAGRAIFFAGAGALDLVELMRRSACNGQGVWPGDAFRQRPESRHLSVPDCRGAGGDSSCPAQPASFSAACAGVNNTKQRAVQRFSRRRQRRFFYHAGRNFVAMGEARRAAIAARCCA